MSNPIANRYDFVVFFDVENGNPNGDPDAGNMPRIDPETGYGVVTDVCLKRKIRNYVETVKEGEPGFEIYIKEGVPLNVSDRRAYEELGIDPKETKKLKKDNPQLDVQLRDCMCKAFYDIRTFGAVMTTFVKDNLNCGQVRGPVQLTFSRSVDPIIPQEVTITRGYHQGGRCGEKGYRNGPEVCGSLRSVSLRRVRVREPGPQDHWVLGRRP